MLLRVGGWEEKWRLKPKLVEVEAELGKTIDVFKYYMLNNINK